VLFLFVDLLLDFFDFFAIDDLKSILFFLTLVNEAHQSLWVDQFLIGFSLLSIFRALVLDI